MQTDRQTDKSSRWSFTAFEAYYHLLEDMPDFVAEWGWQDEIAPTTGQKHRQGFIRTKGQVRFSRMHKAFPGIHIEVAKNWQALKKYCSKSDTRDPSGNQVHVEQNPREYLRMHDALRRIAEVWVEPDMDTDTAISVNEKLNTAYWRAVMRLLDRNPEDISLYSNNQLKSAWTNTRFFWINEYRQIQELEQQYLEDNADVIEAEIDCASVSADFISTE